MEIPVVDVSSDFDVHMTAQMCGGINLPFDHRMNPEPYRNLVNRNRIVNRNDGCYEYERIDINLL